MQSTTVAAEGDIPGTVIMYDHDGVHLQTNQSDIVLVPQPSDSPKDPLNWSKKWKAAIMIVHSFYVFICVAPTTSLAPILPPIEKELHIPAGSDALILIGVTTLTLGFGNFIIVPCSNIFGRRVTAIICTSLGIACTIWEAVAKTYHSFFISRVIIGIPTAANQSLMVQVVTDVHFVHERGLWSGVYFTIFFLGLFIGPVISGAMGQAHGWRSFFWLYTGFQIFNLMTLVIGGAETRWDRKDTIVEPMQHRNQPRHEVDVRDDSDGLAKDASSHLEENVASPTLDDASPQEHNLVGKGRPAWSQYKLWQPVNKDWKRELSLALLSPWLKFFNPIIIWAGFVTGQTANLFLYWIVTENGLFGAPPYNFSTAQIGYTNLAFAVGGLVGVATAGPLSDWVSKKMTARNNGVREAEFRLLALIPFFATTLISIFVGGTAYIRQWPWPAVIIPAFGLTGLAVTTLPTVAIAYATECYNPISGDIMVVVTVIKDVYGFAETYFATGMVAKYGYLGGAAIQGSTVLGFLVLALPLYLWGKKIRRYTRNSNWHRHQN